MLALSLRQPWAWLILRPDIEDPAVREQMIKDDKIKCIENRSWATHVRGPVWIHASLRDDTELVRFGVKERYGIDVPDIPDLGGIVGVTEIVDCVRQHPSRWFVGPFGFTLKNSRPVKFFPLRGQRIFWETGLEYGDLEYL
jgi:hypothetical protein